MRKFVGHGIGKSFMRNRKYHTTVLRSRSTPYKGMTFTIEPMINEGTWKTKMPKMAGLQSRKMASSQLNLSIQ